jgi:putative transposase
VKFSYQYKLRPNKDQCENLELWLNKLRCLYNWFLADRIDGYHQTFLEGEYCDLRTKTIRYPLTCSLTKNTLLHNPWKKPDQDGLIKKRSASLMQDAYLAEMKKARPWYQGIHSNVLQLLVKRLDDARDGFFKQGRGFPKFKNRSNFRSFQYKPGDVKIKGNKIYLPSIGWMRFFNSRSIPDGFEIRTVTIRKGDQG